MNVVRKRGGPLERKEVIESNEEGTMLFTNHSLTHTRQTYTSHTLFLVVLLMSMLVRVLIGSP